MTSQNKLLRKMVTYLNEEKRAINQFHLTASHTITELYKADNYTDRLNAIIKRLDCLLYLEGKLKKGGLNMTNSKDYANTINNISSELQFLKSTNNAMEDNLNEINKTEDFHITISGRIMTLKKQINRIIKKTDKIIPH